MSAVHHVKKFDGGRSTPQEFHVKHAFPPTAKCLACSARPSVRAIVMMPLDEAEKRGLVPLGAAAMPMSFPELPPVLVPIMGAQGKTDYYVRLSKVYSCSRCEKALTEELKKAPSWCIVEVNRGPDPTNRVVRGRL